MPAEDCGDLRTIAWTGEQEGAPICLGIRYSRAHGCRPCMMAIAPQGGKGVLPGQMPIRGGPAQDLPTVGVRTQVRTVRTHAQTESAISSQTRVSPQFARVLCFVGGANRLRWWFAPAHEVHTVRTLLRCAIYPVRPDPLQADVDPLRRRQSSSVAPRRRCPRCLAVLRADVRNS